MGGGLQGVQAGAVAGGGGGVPGQEPVRVPGVPWRAEDVHGEGRGVRADEGDRGEHPGEVRDGGGGGEREASVADDHENGRRVAGEGKGEEQWEVCLERTIYMKKYILLTNEMHFILDQYIRT